MTTLTHEDLPRKDGVPIGAYHITHRLPDYSLSGYGFRFENGRTVEAIGGRVLLRLLYACAADLTVVPADEATAIAVCEHLHYRQQDARLREVSEMCAALFAPVESDEELAKRDAKRIADELAAEEALALAEKARHDAEAAERARIEEDEFAAALAAEEAANAAKASTPDAAPEGAGESSPGAAAPSTSKPKVKSK